MDNLNYYELYLMSRAVFTCDPRTTNIVTLVAVEPLNINIRIASQTTSLTPTYDRTVLLYEGYSRFYHILRQFKGQIEYLVRD